jgi:membrane-associated phospholipid phosphatase
VPTDGSAPPAGPSLTRLRSTSGLRPAWWGAALAVVVLVAVLADVLNHGVLTHIDHSVSARMRDWDLRDGGSYHVIYPLTWFGQRGPVLIVGLPVAAALAWCTRSLELIVRLIVALILLTVVVYVFKDWVARSAPPIDGLHTRDGQSFPSGHLANSVLVWGLLAWYAARESAAGRRSVRAARGGRARALAVLAAVLRVVRIVGPIAVVVGMTLLDFHWISDFVAGAAIGVALLWVVTAPLPDRAGALLRPSAAR